MKFEKQITVNVPIKFLAFFGNTVQCVLEKRPLFEIKQQCRAFEFECFNSLNEHKNA